ncbi:MAG: hypothetical protein ACD_61C00177G0001, partial [uncultured bacterium]
MVSTHEGTSTFVLLDEGDQGGGSPDYLSWDNVDVLDFIDVGFDEFTTIADRNPFLSNDVVFALNTRVGNIGIFFIVGGQINDLFPNFENGFATFDNFVDFEIGCFEEAVRIDTGVKGQVGNQTNVRAFGRTDGADPGVLRRVNITHGE